MANFGAYLPGHFIKHKPLISEECSTAISLILPTTRSGTGNRNTGFGYPKYWFWVSEIRVWGTHSIVKKFFANFLPNLIIFQGGARAEGNGRGGTLKNYQIFGRKRRKALFKLPSTHFSAWFLVPENQILGIRSATTPCNTITSKKSTLAVFL